jgi:hypothetical protein
MEKISFAAADMEESVELFVLEQTKINGVSYLLVTEDNEECFILKEKTESENVEALYETVEDDVELNAVSKVFEELLEDVDFERI